MANERIDRYDVVNVGKNAMDVNQSVMLLPYSKIIINVSKEGDNVVSYIAGDDTGLPLEFDCPWGTQEMANNLLNKMRGYQYQPYDTTQAIVNPASEMGDAVSVNDVYGGIYQQDSTFYHTFYSDFSAPQDEQLDHEFTYESPVERRLSRQEATAKATFQIQNDAIEAKVSKQKGQAVENSFSWKLLDDKFQLFSGTRAVFTCNSTGIIVDGEIRARTGYIGTDSEGFVITNKYIANNKSTYSDGNNGVYLGTDGIGLGSGKFYVTKDGTFYARDGYIGNDSTIANRWRIGDKSIYKGTTKIDDTNEGIYLGTDGIRVYKSSTNSVTFKADGTLTIMKGMTSAKDTNNGMFIDNNNIVLGGGKFKVDNSGNLYAKKGYIGDSDNYHWEIGTRSIYNGTTGLTSDITGAYVGTDGIRVFSRGTDTTPNKGFTFKSNGTFEILGGMTSFDDDDETHHGSYFGSNGIALGGGKFSVDNQGNLTAKSGTIGRGESPWVIGDNNIHYGKEKLEDYKDGVYLGSDGIEVGRPVQKIVLEYQNRASIPNEKLSTTKYVYYSIDENAYFIYTGVGSNPWEQLHGGLENPKAYTESAGFRVTSYGALEAKSGEIGQGDSPWTIGYNSIYYIKDDFNGYEDGVYIGSDGIAIGEAIAKEVLTYPNLQSIPNETLAGNYVYHTTDDDKYVIYTGIGMNPWKYLKDLNDPDAYIATAGFKVSSSGNLEANTGTFRGKVITEYGSKINGSYLDDGSVSGDAIEDGAVTGDKIEDEAVTSGKIGSGAVTSGKVGSKAVSKGNTDHGQEVTNGQTAFEFTEDASSVTGVSMLRANTIYATSNLNALDDASVTGTLTVNTIHIKASAGAPKATTWTKMKDYDGNTVYALCQA